MTWQPGKDKVAELLDAAELQHVAADHRVAGLLLDDAARHLATAAVGMSSGDLSGAYQLAYDALRKSAASLLAEQGLRATSRGGHIAIQEAAQAQFGSAVRAFRSFGRIRRARNNFEYPTTIAPGPSPDDVRDAITTATQARDAAVTILEQKLLTPW
jgi:hypothetical protein